MIQKVDSIVLFRNGNLAAIDPDGNRIPEMQKTTVPQMLTDWCQSNGYDIDNCRLYRSSAPPDISGLPTLRFNQQTGQWEPVR